MTVALPRRATGRYLHTLNPLATIAAPLPAMLALVFTRDIATPVTFIALGYLLLLTGARLSTSRLVLLFIALPIATAILAVGFSLWTDAGDLDHSTTLLRIGDYHLYLSAVEIGAATALRLVSIVVLALLTGLTSSGPDLVRSAVAHLRVPYRIGYAALASYRFVPRFRAELDVIRKAHRVRGTMGGRGPIAAVRRTIGYIVPLLASAIRHAERVSLSMDARAFGAHPSRTERYELPLRPRDAAFVVAFWAVTMLIFAGLLFF
ncbi:energy-coupling factor transporter transmembrane component T [Paramicrobacterium agarici]|uniref:energy-coupling factor transporter transmembrane component T n=1 Tax=Paramicrobacterium agarici TaxID=630514 RepID=UPI0011520D74|nr:energy-coupling factor transporter transmembrane component T [Microbacterium agarici]TQO23426.1 energy-coupling factor transport system permease protein [Microbacterium agarici]